MRPMMMNEQMFINFHNQMPNDVKGTLNSETLKYKRLLYFKIYSKFKFTLPEEWKKNWFRFFLFHCGSISVLYTNEYGWVCMPYGVTKFGIYYQPIAFTVSNHLFTSPKTGIVGVNGGIVHVFDDFLGFDDIVTRYAEKLAQCDKDININLMNANISMQVDVDNKKEADEIKEAYARATQGEPLVLTKKKVMKDGFKPLFPKAKDTFIGNDLQTLKRSIINEFLTEIGIMNANTDKKERLITDEVNANNEETKTLVEVALENIKKCFDEINKISGLGLKVELNNYGGDKDDSKEYA